MWHASLKGVYLALINRRVRYNLGKSTFLCIDPSKVRDAILQGVQNYWDERAAIAITHTNYYEEW